MSRRWPGWEDHPGLEIAPIAAFAATRKDRRAMVRVIAGPHGARGWADCFWLIADADGGVSLWGLEDTWEVVTEDGKITGLREIANNGTLTLIRAPMVAVPGSEAMPVVCAYYVPEARPLDEPVPVEAVADTCCDDDWRAVVTIVTGDFEQQVTSSIWGITPESAHAMIEAMTQRHGPPAGEWLASGEDMTEMQKRITGLGVVLLGCDCEDDA